MNIGEEVTHEGRGVVTGNDTGRVVATFSHEAEADSFCRMVNDKQFHENIVARRERLVEEQFQQGLRDIEAVLKKEIEADEQ